MQNGTMSYSKCACQNCGSQYATQINDEAELQKESCPKCGEKKLTITGPMSFSEISSLFGGG